MGGPEGPTAREGSEGLKEHGIGLKRNKSKVRAKICGSLGEEKSGRH